MKSNEPLRGQVRMFNHDLGYGWIEMDDGHQVFVHYTAIQTNGFRALLEGDVVMFELDANPHGERARDVVVISREATEEAFPLPRRG